MDSDDAAAVPDADCAVLCAGQVVADIFVPPLTVMPRPGELVVTGDMLTGVGGCSANVAVVLAHLGVRTAVAAVVGQDGHGDWVRAELSRRGVDSSHLVRSASRATSQTVVIPVVGDDRRYIHAIGANAEFTAAAIPPAQGAMRVLSVGGFLSLPALDAHHLAETFDQARKTGATTVLDVVIPKNATNTHDTLLPVLRHADWFTPNIDEAALLTGTSSVEAQAKWFLERGARRVVITCGADGAVYADADRMLRAFPVTGEVVDASGAGDAFSAGLIFGIIRNWDVARSLQFATILGASVTRALGTTTSLCTLTDALIGADRVVIDQIE